MQLRAFRALLAAAAAVAVGGATGATAQRDAARDGGVLALLQREFEKSSEMLEQFWDSAFGANDENEEDEGVRVVVVDLDVAPPPALTADEKTLACLVAVQRVEEQAVLAQENQRVHARLRTPLGRLVSFQFEDETSCEDLATPLLADECARVAAMGDEIELFLREGKSPEEICDAVRLLDEMMMEDEAKDDTPLSCKLCKRFVQMVVQAIKQDMAQVQQVREILGDICDSMAADSMCHTFIKNYDDIVNWLTHGTDSEVVCERISMCSAPATANANAEALVVVAPKAVPTVSTVSHACFYCEHITGVIEFVVQHAPQQVGVLRPIVKFGCKLSPKDCKCDLLVQNFDKIVGLLQQAKSPKEVCEAIGMCKAGEDDPESSKMLALATSPATSEQVAKLFLTAGSALKHDKTCFYCEYFSTLLEVALQQDPTDVDQIRQYADLICGMLGDSNKCHQYVDNLDKVIDALKSGKKPKEICTDLKFCPKAVVIKPAPVTVNDDKTCFYCDYFVTLLEVVMQEDEAQVEQIRQYADLICGMLGDDNVCHQYLNKFDAAIDALKQGKKPREICTQFKFCTKSQKLMLPPPVAKGDDKQCLYCDMAATALEVILQEDPNDLDGVRLYADILCGMLGDDNVCHQYVNKLNFAIEALKKGQKPREICAQLKFCTAKQLPAGVDTSSLLTHSMDKSVVTASSVHGIDNCFFCTQLASLFKVAMAQDSSKVSEIRMVADLICNALPTDNKCHSLMRQIDQVIDSIQNGEEPAAICQDLKFCTKASTGLVLPAAAHGAQSNVCAYCDGVATVLEYAIKQKPDQVQQLREAAGIVCDFMPADDKCHDLKMFDKAVVALEGGKSPHAVCLDLSYCTSSSAASTESKLTPLSVAKLDMLDAKALAAKAQQSEKSMSVGCLLCEYTAEGLVLINGDESKLRLAKQALETMCFVLPPTARCDVLSSKFDNLAQLVGEGKSPSAACHALSLCDAAFVEPASPERKRISDVMADHL